MNRLLLLLCVLTFTTYAQAQTCDNSFYISYTRAAQDSNPAPIQLRSNIGPEPYATGIAMAFKSSLLVGFTNPDEPTVTSQVSASSYIIDTIYAYIGHENNSGLNDTIIVFASQNDSATGPVPNTVFWSDTIITNVGLSPGNNWANIAGYILKVPASIPVGNTQIAIGMQYFGSINDSMLVYGTSNLGSVVESEFSTSYLAFQTVFSGWRLTTDLTDGLGPIPQQNWFINAHICYEEPLAVEENDALNAINIYPNPAQNNLTINLGKTSPEGATIQVLNTLGQVVKTNGFNKTTGQNLTVDLSGLATGLYFVQVQAFGGSKAFRIVKN